MRFLLKVVPTALWFAFSCAVGFIVSVLRWGDPSNGHRFARIFAWGGLRLLGIQVRVVNAEGLVTARPCVYVANHQSMMDLFFCCHFYPPRTLVTGKKEVIWIPFFGIMFYAMGNVILDRQRRGKAIAALDRAVERIRNEQVSVWVFAEGTRNRGGPMLPFKKGAFRLAMQAGVSIVPLVLGPHARLLDPRRFKADPGVLEVRVLEPIPTAGLDPADVDALIARTRAAMEEAMRLADAGTGPA